MFYYIIHQDIKDMHTIQYIKKHKFHFKHIFIKFKSNSKHILLEMKINLNKDKTNYIFILNI